MSATTAPSNFVEMVLNHLDIIYQCPHYLFDGLSSHAKLTFDDSVKKLVDEMKRENSKVDRCEGEVTSKFESLRHTRMQKFLFAQGMRLLSSLTNLDSLIEGEQNWFKLLKWSSSTLIHSALRRIYVRYYSWGVISRHAVDIIKQYSPVLEVGAGNGYWAYELARHGVDIVATDNYSDLVDDFEPLRYWYSVEHLEAVEAIKKFRGRTLLMCWPHGYALDALEEFGEEDGLQTVIIIGEKCERNKFKYGDGEVGCVTDDPFGGVNKERDCMMMSQVRNIMDEQPEQNHTVDTDFFDPTALRVLADRYKKVQSRWKLVREVSIPNFVTTEEDETICDCLYIWQKYQRQNIVATPNSETPDSALI